MAGTDAPKAAGATPGLHIVRRGLACLGVRLETCWELVVLGVYAATVIYFSSFHELWRDEVRALSIATEARSVVDLFARLHNEGHPGLWHLLLYLSYSVFRSPVVLTGCALGVAIASAWVFLLRSPFSRWQKLLFLLGVFPLYEYSVMARNYGIGMLFLFCSAALYRDRFRRPLTFSFTVFLLAHTNAYCLLIAMAILGAACLEFVVRAIADYKHTAAFQFKWRNVAGLVFMAVGCATSVLTILTDSHSKILRPNELSFHHVEIWLRAVRTPLRVFAEGFGLQALQSMRHKTLASWLLWALVASLLRRPFIFLFFAAAYVAMGAFASTVYVCVLRHQGFAFLVLLTALWLAKEEAQRRLPPALPWLRRLAQIPQHAVTFGVTLLLLAQLPNAYQKVRFDYENALSSSKQFGEFIASHPQYRDAIIVAEADYFFESIPYYAKNELYLPRERRFGPYAEFTTRNRDRLTLDELMLQARNLRARTQRPILFGFSFALTPTNPYQVRMGYRVFVYSQASYDEFISITRKVASIRASQSAVEFYDFYELK